MKIAILGPAYPYRGGIAAFSERLARQFIVEGHQVHLLTFTLQYPSFLFPGKTQYSDSPAPDGLKISRVVNSCAPLNWLKVGRMIRKSDFDLLVIMFWMPFMAPCQGTIARVAKKGGRTKVVTVVHNIIPHEKKPGDRLFAKYMTGSADRFVALSESVINDLDTLGCNKPKTLSPHPLYDHFGEKMNKDAAAVHLGLSADTDYILFFGFIREYKGLDWLLEAFADERLKALNVKLIIAGEYYGDSEKYTALADRLGVSQRIEWRTDFIPDSEVKYYFNVADLVVQPYKSATQSGVSQIAYHFEKPMVVTDVGGLAEIVPDGKAGYVVEPRPQAIADAIFDFFSNGRQHDFDEGIKAQKKKYSWAEMTKSVIG